MSSDSNISQWASTHRSECWERTSSSSEFSYTDSTCGLVPERSRTQKAIITLMCTGCEGPCQPIGLLTYCASRGVRYNCCIGMCSSAQPPPILECPGCLESRTALVIWRRVKTGGKASGRVPNNTHNEGTSQQEAERWVSSGASHRSKSPVAREPRCLCPK